MGLYFMMLTCIAVFIGWTFGGPDGWRAFYQHMERTSPFHPTSNGGPCELRRCRVYYRARDQMARYAINLAITIARAPYPNARARSLSAYFCTLPVDVFGISAKTTVRGHL